MRERSRSRFEPRPFIAAPERADSSSKTATNPDLIDSYLQLRRIASPQDAPASATIQRAVKDDAPYANGNENGIKDHVKGEWGENSNGAVAGGHLYTTMRAKWGNWTADEAHSLQPGNRDAGLYLTHADTLSSKITNARHEFFIIKGGRVSKTKSSTFWPKTWSAADLGRTLQNSYKTNTNNIYASTANTSYWYTWEELGGNTAFPKARYGKKKDIN